MLIRLVLFFSTGFFLIGCASTPRYSNSTGIDEKLFENDLTNSTKIYREPIDILQDEFSDPDSMIGHVPDVASSGANNKSNSFPNLENGFGVQIASFSSKKNADNYLFDLKKKRLIISLNVRYHDGYWRVFAGLYKTRNEAEKSKLRIQSYGYLSAWIIILSTRKLD